MKSFHIHLFILLIAIVFTCCKKDNNNDSTVVDADGNVYHTLIIGKQTWLAENLKTTKYNDGTDIPNVTDNTEWINLTSIGAYCNYDNTEVNANTYGRLYNWHAVNTGKLAPKGWHVPTIAEWDSLVNYMSKNGYNYDGTLTGNKIGKALASTVGWGASTVTGAIGNTDYPEYRNKSGFSALPAGLRGNTAIFNTIGNKGFFWSSTVSSGNSNLANGCYMFNDYTSFGMTLYEKITGFSVRCIKD